MYLVLSPRNCLSGRKSTTYDSFFTEDGLLVSQHLEGEGGSKAYKLDALTELTEIEVTYQEVTKETKND